MKINVGKIKKKALTKFDSIVKSATARAIPVAKKEMITHLTSGGSMNFESIASFVTGAAIVGSVIFAVSGANAKSIASTAQTVINIENLNLYLAAPDNAFSS